MREIKFRTWHTRYKEMIEPRTIAEMSDTGYWYSNSRNEIVLLQYTGLHGDDEDGTELYEGDIAELMYNLKTIKCTVKFEGGGFIFVSDKFEDGYTALLDIAEFDRNYGWIPYCDIIGNVFENPELIEVSA